MLKKLNALIVDSDVTGRTRLREVLKHIALSSEAVYVRDVNRATSMLQTDQRFDCIFISSAEGIEEIKKFVNRLSGHTRASKMPVIVTLQPKDLKGSLVASFFMAGVHGFISPPYSADTIMDLISATRESLESGPEASKKAESTAGFLIESMMTKLDRLAVEKAGGQEGGGYSGRELKVLSESLKELTEQLGDSLPGILVKKFSAANPPVVRPGQVKAKKKRKPDHPGVYIEQVMQSRHITKDMLFARVKIDPDILTGILERRISLDRDMAKEFARVLGETPGYWYSLQTKFDKEKLKPGK